MGFRDFMEYKYGVYSYGVIFREQIALRTVMNGEGDSFMSQRTIFVAVAALMFGATAWAHHNMSAIYDFNDKITMTGTLSKIDWRNPHIELIVATKNGGSEVQSWSLEGPSPSFFRTRDINKSDVETAIDKTVTAEASRARDGSRAGLLRTMTLPDGKVISACPQNC
jgi:hypothetical protein